MSRKGDGLDGDKVEALRRYHALNPHPEKVKDEAFIKGAPFFDARDLVQVKYEMLRRVREGYQSVTPSIMLKRLSSGEGLADCFPSLRVRNERTS
jgi:hypothetical protein